MRHRSSNKPRRNKPKRRFYRRGAFWVALSIPVLIGLYGAILFLTLPQKSGTEVSMADFLQRAETPATIQKAVLLNGDNRVLFVDHGERHWTQFPVSQQYLDTFVIASQKNKIPLRIDSQVVKATLVPMEFLIPALVLAAVFLLVFLLMRSSASSPFLRAAAQRGSSGRPVTFADVAGMDEAVAEAAEIRDYLMNPERFEEIGAEAPRGVLLVGPPGTGKTLLARAVAGEAGVAFFAMSGTDFVEMYVGVGAARVRDVFRQVRERAPAILFIDELDSVGRTRVGGASAGNDERDQTLNQLLVELDGFDRSSGVVLMAATNRPDVLDPALLRRGRFDRQILVDRPDRTGRQAILAVHARGKHLDPSVDLQQLAGRTPGLTGADLASVLNEAALLTARRGRARITDHELDDAIDRTLNGSEGRIRVLTPAEKSTVAYHEAGHALVGLTFPDAGPVTRVSIVSRARAVGFTEVTGQEEQVVSQKQLMHRLAVFMAGRAAEEIVLDSPTAGSGSDLRRATKLARRMACEFGMSEALGRRALGNPLSASFLGDERLEPDYAGEVAVLIDREIRRMVDEGFALAQRVLASNRGPFEALVKLLIERETLREPELKWVASQITLPDEPTVSARAVTVAGR